MKTPLTKVLLALRSLLRWPLTKPICLVFGHNYWFTTNEQIFATYHYYRCRRCKTKTRLEPVIYSFSKTLHVLTSREHSEK